MTSPDERIAKHPLAQRDSCKLLVRTAGGELSEHIFSELPELLPADAMLVCNNTRVINARLRFRKPGGALIEIFCLEPVTPHDYAVSFASTSQCSWTCFVGNSKRWKEGLLTMPLEIGGRSITFTAERLDKMGQASVVEFRWDNPSVTFSEIIAAVGEIPIPPVSQPCHRGFRQGRLPDSLLTCGRIGGSPYRRTAFHSPRCSMR